MEKQTKKLRKPPARTIEQRQNELINAAYTLAERQILAGTASSQVLTHFLKMGTVREELELEKLKRETTLLEAKVESLRDMEKLESLAKEAIEAMKSYKGESSYDD